MAALLCAARQWLNAIGLALSIIGVVLIWKWGLPQPSFERGTWLAIEPNTPLPSGKTAAQVDEEKAAEEALYRYLSKLGSA